jgi:excinuclease UvrABC nuclease subunit
VLFVFPKRSEAAKKRAETLLEHFGGVESVMSATEEELAEVAGIGTPIAEKIRNLVCEASVPYRTIND